MKWKIFKLFAEGLFSPPKPPPPDPSRVRVFDFKKKESFLIPANELAPGMIEASMEGEGIVWVNAKDLVPSPIRHPNLPEPLRDSIRELQGILYEVRPMSFEDWEDGFKRDRDPNEQVSLWRRMADAYQKATKDHFFTLEQKKEIFHLINACTLSSRENIFHVFSAKALTKSDAERIVTAFYDGSE